MRERLDSARLELAQFRLGDVGALHELFADPLTHTMGAGPFTAIAQTRQWIEKRLVARRERGLCWYALRERVTGRLVGNCGVFPGREGVIEIGYLVGAEFRGRGFAGEAAAAVLGEARAAGVGTVWASVRPENLASRRVLARLGMVLNRSAADEHGPLLWFATELNSSVS